MGKPNQNLREMLRDLGRALSEAIADSPEVNRTLRRIRREGYTLHLLLDCKREAEEAAPLAVPRSREVGSGELGEPSFQINARDLSFLRSIGIDPTRRLRRRRG